MPPFNTSRRDFIRKAATLAVVTGPAARAFAAGGVNSKVNLAFIGIGNRGNQVAHEFARFRDLFNVVALADTEMGHARTLDTLKLFPQAARFTDFRKMFDAKAKELDAVVVCTPDSGHFPAAMMTMGLGKHLYIEKPMAHTFREVELMIQSARKHKVITQMGNQGHSGPNYYQFRALAQRGFLNDVTRIVAHMNMARRWHKWNGKIPPEAFAAQPLPAGLDWETWLGQNPWHDYNVNYLNGDWRCWYDFGNGALGDWGAHIFDTAHEFLDLGLPEQVEVRNVTGHTDKVFPMNATVVFKFPARDKLPACDIEWYEGRTNLPDLPKGYGELKAATDIPSSGNETYKEIKSLPPGKEIYTKRGLVLKGGSHSSTLELVGEKDAQVEAILKDFPTGQPDHYKAFVLAIRGEAKNNSPFELAGPLSQVMCMGCIAQKLNRSFRFDRTTKRIVNDPVADAMLDGPAPRKGWEAFYKI